MMRNRLVLFGTVGAVGLLGQAVTAGVIPPPANVPGKEYSHHLDEDFAGNLDFLQNIWWDGLGNAADTFDYTGSAQPPWDAPQDPDQVDALANHQDYLFREVVSNQVPMLVSLDQPAPNDIRFHTVVGNTGIWATAPVINAGRPPDQVDALEIWETVPDGSILQVDDNPNTPDDANHFSIIGDALGPGISVFYYDEVNHASFPYIFQPAVVAALGFDPTDPVADQIDIDALMVFDLEGDRQWGPGDTILFSLWPIPGVFDGGEIWVWQNGQPAQFLFHGGRLWDTANPVGTIFGLNTENIDSLEAIVPSPPALLMLLAGGLTIARRRRGA